MIRSYWQKFLKINQLELNTIYKGTFYFGIDEKDSNYLLELVLNGKKKATSSSLIAYEITNQETPKVGDYWIVTSYNGEPKCIIKTTKVRKIKFKEMTYDIAKLEGENLTLESWKSNHDKFFEIESEELGYKYDHDMYLIFEEFEMVYK